MAAHGTLSGLQPPLGLSPLTVLAMTKRKIARLRCRRWPAPRGRVEASGARAQHVRFFFFKR